MTPHRIPLAAVRARLLYRTGETVFAKELSAAYSQEYLRQVMPQPINSIKRTWSAGSAFARGVIAGGHCAALSEPINA